MRKSLSDAGVAALKPRAASYAFPDPELRKHYVRVHPSGRKSFVVVALDASGKQVWATLGGTDLLTIAEAREKAREVIKLILDGMPPHLASSAAGSLEKRIAVKAAAFTEHAVEPAGYLYRAYDPRGDLVYCAASLAPFKPRAPWRRMVFKILIEPFARREEVLEAERRAIEQEFPKFNRAHNQRRHFVAELRRIEQTRTERGKPHA